MKMDPHAYNITIRRDIFEGETLFEARVRELPDLVEYAETYDEAYALAIDTIETAAEAFAEMGRAFPQAITPVDDYSGRVTLRLPRSLHRVLAETADDEGVSLNQHLVNVLNYFSGFATGYQARESSGWESVKAPVKATSFTSKPSLRIIPCNDFQEKNQAWG